MKQFQYEIAEFSAGLFDPSARISAILEKAHRKANRLAAVDRPSRRPAQGSKPRLTSWDALTEAEQTALSNFMQRETKHKRPSKKKR